MKTLHEVEVKLGIERDKDGFTICTADEYADKILSVLILPFKVKLPMGTVNEITERYQLFAGVQGPNYHVQLL